MIIDYLINNREHIKALVSIVEKQKKEVLARHSFFDDIIEQQFKNEVRIVIANDVALSLAISYEDVIIELESISLEEFLSTKEEN